MKEANFLKRLSAITLAAAITAANVGFDFLPTAKKAAAEPKEEKSVTEVTTPKVMTQKSKYPTSLSFIVEKNENGESVLRASNPTVFNQYFTATIVSLDQPAEGEEPEQLEFSADGTVIRVGGNYSVNVKARINEETGEPVYNPYRIIESAVMIEEAEEIPEAEAVDQEIAVLEESEFVEEIAEEAVSEELAEIVEVPELTEISLNICESDVNAAVGMFDMSQSQKLDYIVVKSQDYYNVMIPDDYNELFLNGIDEEGNGFFNAAGEDVQVNFNEVEMNIQVVNFAELRIKDIAEPEEYSIERFCGDESLPYYYGEIIKVTPDAGYNIVVGDMKFSDAVSVEINNDALDGEQAEIKVFEGESESKNFVVKEIEDGKFTVELDDGKLPATKYTLSVPIKNHEPRVSQSKPLTFTLDEVETNDGIIRVDVSNIVGISFIGFDPNIKKSAEEHGFECEELSFPLKDLNLNDTNWYKDGYYTPHLQFKQDVNKISITQFVIKTASGDELAEYDADLNLITKNCTITNKGIEKTKDAGFWKFPINSEWLNNVHEDLCLYIDYSKIQTVTFSFTVNSKDNQVSNSNYVTALLNGKDFSTLKSQEDIEKALNNDKNTIKFSSSNENWVIKSVALNKGKAIDAGETGASEFDYEIGSADEVRNRGNHEFIVTLNPKQIKVKIDCNINDKSVFSVKNTAIKPGEVKTFNAGNVELSVSPNLGYYVESITKEDDDGTSIIYSDEINADKFNSLYKRCEVILSETCTRNTTFTVVLKKAITNDDIEAHINFSDYNEGKYVQNGYDFTILSDIEKYEVSFRNKKDEKLSFFKKDEYSTVYQNYISKDNILTETANVNGEQNLTYYVIDGIKVYEVTLNVKSITPTPEITKFEIKKASTVDTILNILTFGIFSNGSVNITVYAEDTSNNGFKISDIKLYNNNDTNNPIEGSFISNDDGTAYKTFTLPLSDNPTQYNLTAQAFAKFVSKSDEEDENAVQGNLFTLNIVKKEITPGEYENEIVAVNSETAIIPVIIDNVAPTVKLTPSAAAYEGIWYNGNVNFNLTVNDSENSNGIISGIHTVTYEISDEENKTLESHTIDEYKNRNKDNYTDNYEMMFKIDAIDNNIIKRTVTANACDNAGNEGKATPVTVNIDKQKPEISIDKVITADGNTYNGDWTNQDVTINFTVTDEGSGIQTVKVNNGDLKGAEDNDTNTHTKHYSCVVSKDYSGEITIDTVDNVGNPVKQTIANVKIDKTAPEIEGFQVEAISGYNESIDYTNLFNVENYKYHFDTPATVSINASDNLSGVSEIILGGIPNINDVINEDNITIIGTANGPNAKIPVPMFDGIFCIKLVDNIGNESQWYTHDMLVAEDMENHKIHSEAEIILSEAPYSNGTPLYSENPSVTFKLKDIASGIDESTISYSVNVNGENVPVDVKWLDDKTIKKFNVVTYKEGTIDLGAYEGNNIKIELSAKDNAKNEIIAATQTISIDKSAPELLSIKFNPEGSDKQEFFNKQRTATIRVKDRNLNTENLNDLLDVTVTNALGTSAAPYKVTKKWEVVEPKTGEELAYGEKVYECVITFVQDAEYSFTMEVKDLTEQSLKLDTYKFTIDTTQPKLSITFDNNSKANGKYYNAARKATLTINEHNFAKNKDTVKSVLSAKRADGITTMDSKEIYDGKLTWTQSSSNKDEWTAQVNFNKEGTFDFSMAYTDPAGNSGNNADSGEFVIDTTAPKIDQTFTKSGNKFATNGDFVPHVTFSDYNFLSENQIGTNCKVTIKKIGSDGLSKENFSSTSRTYTAKNSDSPVTFEQIFDIFGKDIEVDGIYEIDIKAEDLAGNVTEKNDLTVSINRYGSTYMIVNEEARAAVEKYAIDGIPIKDNIKLELAEVNVTPQKVKGVVNINVNGKDISELKDGVKTSESRVSLEDDSWENNENGWYQTLYEIDKKNFAEDGVYTITLYSEDEAGNKNFSDSPKPPRDKFAVTFAVDATAPKIDILGVDDEYEYDVDEVDLTITCSDKSLYNIDNLSYDANNKDKSTFYLKLNDNYYDINALKSQLGAEITNDAAGNMNIQIKVKSNGKDSKQSIDVFLVDKAGNSTIAKVNFVLSVPNRLIMLILIAAGVIVLGTAVFFVTKKVRSR